MSDLRNPIPIYLLAAVGLFLFLGCGKKITKEQHQALASVALSAKERAVAFELVRAFMLDEKSGYLDSHSRGLASDAKALSDFSKAASMGALKPASIDAIKVAAENARARHQNFVAAMSRLQIRAETLPPDKFVEFLATHELALAVLANQIEMVALMLVEEKK